MTMTQNGRTPKKPAPKWATALKLRRVELGLAQEDVAARSNDVLSQKNVSDFERGKVHLLEGSFGRVVALARALDWSLSEMQKATGLDLGIPESTLTFVGSRTAPVYPLGAAANPALAPLPGIVEVLRGTSHPERMQVFVMQGNEMTRTTKTSIQDGDHLYTNLDDIEPREGRIYVINVNGAAHVRRYVETPLGFAWMPDNKEHPPIPPSNVAVVGSVYRVVGDRPENKLTN